MSELVCSVCKTSYPTDEPRWRCDCGGMLDLNFSGELEPDRIAARKPNLWRYLEALPLAGPHLISLGESLTALLPVQFDGRTAWIKQDHLFPSGSYKDRGAAVMVNRIHELGIRSVVEDSSGNAGCAVAAYCAAAGIDCEIFVPESTSPGKLAQIRMYGARLNLVPGSREDTADAVWQAAQTRYYASHVWNPYFFHGTKTWAFEVCEQLGWRAPDSIVIPAGNGTLLLGASIGFDELQRSGITAKKPRIIAVQSQNCAPLYAAYKAGADAPLEIQKEDTLAEGIAIALPGRGKQILEAVRSSQGDFLAVSEEEILDTLTEISRKGFYIEPTAAATIAGLKQYLRRAAADELVVSVFTGHGLKSTEKLLKLAGK